MAAASKHPPLVRVRETFRCPRGGGVESRTRCGTAEAPAAACRNTKLIIIRQPRIASRRGAPTPPAPAPATLPPRTAPQRTTFPQVPFGFPSTPRRFTIRVPHPDLSSLPHAAAPCPAVENQQDSADRTTTFQGPCRVGTSARRAPGVAPAINSRHRPSLLRPHPSSPLNPPRKKHIYSSFLVCLSPSLSSPAPTRRQAGRRSRSSLRGHSLTR